jgi:Xaa-Pro aminopeptidase
MNFLYKNENSIYYEIGYSCDNGILLSLGSEHIFFTDARYTEEAKESAKSNCLVAEASRSLIDTLVETLKKSGVTEVGFDPKEWNVSEFEELKSKTDINLISKPDYSKQKRIIKTNQEIEYLSTAARYGKSSFQRFKDYLSVKGIGKKESELHYKLSNFLKQKGSLGLSFDPILAFNENTSKPHARPTDRRLSNGDLVLIDAGVKYKRYSSDRTETFMFQQTKFSSVKMTPKVQKIYDIVEKAHDETIAKAKVGMKASEIDKIARDIITKAGYGEQFVHSTGHGVGLDVHEFPNISAKSDVVIEENMVFTIEPAIYLPNFMGVRIENMVVMQNSGAKVL